MPIVYCPLPTGAANRTHATDTLDGFLLTSRGRDATGEHDDCGECSGEGGEGKNTHDLYRGPTSLLSDAPPRMPELEPGCDRRVHLEQLGSALVLILRQPKKKAVQNKKGQKPKRKHNSSIQPLARFAATIIHAY